jgi:hypothetical protein
MMPGVNFNADNATLRVRFYSRFTPGGAETAYGPYTVRTDGYLDCRVAGRDIRLRIEAAEDGFFSFGQSRLDVRQAGKR